jgi:thiamine-phosphate pyrophosphorylase
MGNRSLLYYITDRSQFSGDDCSRRSALLSKVAEAAAAGVDYIQLREKDLSARQLELLARDCIAVVHEWHRLRTEKKVPEQDLKTQLLINSRTDVALAMGADGVHLRSDDLPPREIRRIVKVASGNNNISPFLVAASCHTSEDVILAEREKADFVVFGPVFGKVGAPGVANAGLDGLRKACVSKIPVFALGGVSVENACACLAAGAAGIAGIRLFQENKIEDVVGRLRGL